jgi:hypothetical protein
MGKATSPSWWTINRVASHSYRLDLWPVRSGDRRRICLLSDLHWDHAACRLDLLKQLLEEAKEMDSPVFLFGDTFDAMQGKWDPRASQDGLRPEHRGGDYLDLLVETAVEWFEPYRDVIAFISPGNHEASIRKRHETDLTSRLVGGLRKAGARTIQGSYWGFISLHIWTGKRTLGNRRVMHYTHGSGGGGEVTRGLIDHSRTRGMYLADVYISGHIHRRNSEENILATLSPGGNVYYQQQLFLRSSCWKDESQSEWHSGIMGRGPRPIGGWWLEIHVDKRGKGDNYQIAKMVPIMN